MNPAGDLIDDLVSNPEDSPSAATPAATGTRLPSGRSVVVRSAPGREELEVRSAEGEMEVRVTLTEEGPVVRLRGARLEVESPDAVAFHCRRFEVHAEEGLDLRAVGDADIRARELRVRTEGDVHMDGRVIRLNCEQAGGEAAGG